MSEQENPTTQEPVDDGTQPQGGTPVEQSWQDVGQQFQELGNALSQAFRVAWESEQNQRRVNDMRSGLESMVSSISKAIDDTAQSPQGQRVRAEAERTVDALRSAGEQTVQEVRPQLINALQQVNQELQKLVDRMARRAPTGAAAGTTVQPARYRNLRTVFVPAGGLINRPACRRLPAGGARLLSAWPLAWQN